jgi:hypothetical protein
MLDTFASADTGQDHVLLVPTVIRDDAKDGLADHL